MVNILAKQVSDSINNSFNLITYIFYLGYRAMRVKVIFRVSSKLQQMLHSANRVPPQYLAYVEWFTPFQQLPNHISHDLKLFQVRQYIRDGARWASIIPLNNISG